MVDYSQDRRGILSSAAVQCGFPGPGPAEQGQAGGIAFRLESYSNNGKPLCTL